MDGSTLDRLERHRLPQSTLHTPLFAGVEPAVVGFEVVVFVLVVNLSQLRLLPLTLTGVFLAVIHIALALATSKDRRLTSLIGRSVRYPRYCRPWPTQRTRSGVPEPTFPARRLS